MTKSWNIGVVLGLALSGCAGRGADEIPEDPELDEVADVGEAEQAISGGGCAITPRTSQDRWYCLATDQTTQIYFRWDNNGSLPWRGEGPYAGTFTRYNEGSPYRTTGTYSNLRATQAINGCQGQVDGFTFIDFNLNGQACTGWAWWRSFPYPKQLSFYCPGDKEFVCWEHRGPRAFGGAGN